MIFVWYSKGVVSNGRPLEHVHSNILLNDHTSSQLNRNCGLSRMNDISFNNNNKLYKWITTLISFTFM